MLARLNLNMVELEAISMFRDRNVLSDESLCKSALWVRTRKLIANYRMYNINTKHDAF